MGESINYLTTISPETGSDEVRAYRQVLRSEDLRLYADAQGMLDDVLFFNTPDHHTCEVYTGKTIDALQDY